ncbi:MAG TPA: ABC transporter substrate-binding protein [Candidatus Pelethocola excrementipullorum]|nr:ABC transporter substrate-binding protein [Candidatus Pelethocola excrementipullorum]
MKKKLSILLALVMTCSLFAACGKSNPSADSNSTKASATATPSPEADDNKDEQQVSEEVTVRVGSMKGPTTMGLLNLQSLAEAKTAGQPYEFTMVTAADELVSKVVGGELDIALVPANMASILYNKTKGGVSVIDINTLGVLYIVASDETITSMEDLKGRTLYLTGKGTTPDYALQYLLKQNGLSTEDVTLEYKSEATEVASVLSQQADAVGLLPQPFATVACQQNEALKIVLNLTEEWDKVSDGSSLVTGVTIVKNDFLAEHPDAVATFMEEHKTSSEYANTNVDETAEAVAASGIIEKAPVAAKAIPYCNITYIDGADMKTKLSGYLQTLFDLDPSSVGGTLPADGFYYLPQ